MCVELPPIIVTIRAVVFGAVLKHGLVHLGIICFETVVCDYQNLTNLKHLNNRNSNLLLLFSSLSLSFALSLAPEGIDKRIDEYKC